MSDVRRFSRKRTLVSYNNLVDKFGQDTFICVDKSLIPIIRALLRTRGLYPSTYYTAIDPNFYTIPDSDQMGLIEDAVANFLEETSDMGTCDDLITVLNNISINLASQATCCGGSAGQSQPPANQTGIGYPGQHTGDPPDGFASWVEYDTYKCDLATQIADNIAKDLAWIAGTSAVAAWIPVLVATLVTPVPFDDIASIAGLLLAISVDAAVATVFGTALIEYNAVKSDVVCALYYAQNAGQSKSQADDVINSNITNSLAARAITTMLGYYTINDLYSNNQALRDIGLPTGDCSSCGLQITTIYGTPDDLSANPITWTWQLSAFAYRITFRFSQPVSFNWNATSGWFNAGFTGGDFQIGTCDGSSDCSSNFNDLYNSDTEPASGTLFEGVRYISMRSDDAAPQPADWEITYTVD